MKIVAQCVADSAVARDSEEVSDGCTPCCNLLLPLDCQPEVSFLVYGVCCMVYGAWCMVYGAWCMVYGVWCMLYGVCCMV